jgi:hypothetical protein
VTFEVTEELSKKVLSVVDAGLVHGIGEPVPGKMCVEAAVCYAMGLPHSDEPTCVSPALRSLKIRLNDSRWSNDEARTKGLRRLAIAQLGSQGALEDKEFVSKVSVLVIQKYVPKALRAAASIKGNAKHKDSLESAALLCSTDPSINNAKKAKTAAAAVAAYAVAAYAAAAYAAYAAADADADADAAAAAAAAAADAAAAYAAVRDGVLSEFGEDVVQILIEMNAPGTKFLYLTEVN